MKFCLSRFPSRFPCRPPRRCVTITAAAVASEADSVADPDLADSAEDMAEAGRMDYVTPDCMWIPQKIRKINVSIINPWLFGGTFFWNYHYTCFAFEQKFNTCSFSVQIKSRGLENNLLFFGRKNREPQSTNN